MNYTTPAMQAADAAFEKSNATTPAARNVGMLGLGVAATFAAVGFAYSLYNRRAEANRTQEAKKAGAKKVANLIEGNNAKKVAALITTHFAQKAEKETVVATVKSIGDVALEVSKFKF